MTEFDKLRVIVTLKKLVIHHQFYEFAANLRDRERKEFGSYSVDLSDCIPQNITPSDYHYMIQVIEDFESYKISLVEEDTNIVLIKRLVEETFRDVIRQIKLTSILK